MAQQSTNFPLFFKLERVKNGYILTAKEDTGGVKEAAFVKEVVAEEKITNRIGQLLKLDTLAKEFPVMFHIEAAGETTYHLTDEIPGSHLAEAKLAYVHFHSQSLKDGSSLVLKVKDSDTLEIYGMIAEKTAKNNNLPLNRICGIPLLTFPNSKEGQKTVASYVGKISLNEVTHQKILDWYDKHKVLIGK